MSFASSNVPPPFPLSYTGQVALPYIVETFDPDSSNNKFNVPTIWDNKEEPNAWILTARPNGVANWQLIADGERVIYEIETDNGTAIPIDNVIILSGGTTGLTFEATDNEIDLTGVLTVPNGGTGFSTSNTLHSVIIGQGTSPFTSVAPSIVSGIPLISRGTGLDPTFSTATVPGGGTGRTTNTAYAVICGGTTGTGALQNVSGVGSLGNILRSAGASALPAWTTATYPATTTANLVLYSSATNVVDQIPTSSNGNVLTLVAGVPAWASNAAIESVNVVVITGAGSGTYTPSANLIGVSVQAIGGAGGAGGAAATNASVAAGSGGAGGDYVIGNFNAATIGASQSYTIGAGGAGGAAGNNNGSPGGATLFGALISAAGGNGGFGEAASDTTCVGGGLPAGTSTGGSFRSPGQGGGSSFGTKNTNTAAAYGGFGGSSFFGGGGTSHGDSTTTGSSTNGNNGTGIGAGGGGGVSVSYTGAFAAASGGPGSSGGLIITEFLS